VSSTAPAAHRRHFIDKSLLYLFSANIEFGMNIEQLGIVPAGVRVNLFCVANVGRIYNVLRERTVGASGYPTVSGSISWGEDAGLAGEDDVAVTNVRATIRTDDDVLVDAQYVGILPLGMGACRALCAGTDWRGTPQEPAEYRFCVTPRYETESPRYRWLMEHVCIGFARTHEVAGLFRRVSYDVYALA
jgi:hypothetical protein